MVLRIMPTSTRFPTNSLYTPLDNTPLHSMSCVCHLWGQVVTVSVRLQELKKNVWLLRIIGAKASPTTYNSNLLNTIEEAASCSHIFFLLYAGTNRTSLSNYLHNGSSAQDYSLRLRVTSGCLLTKFLECSRFLHRCDRVGYVL